MSHSTHAIYGEVRRQYSEQDADAKWTSEQWWQAFVYIFYYAPRRAAHLDVDDLLFLVLSRERGTTIGEKTPYMVLRREGDLLPPEFVIGGERYMDMDWKRTLELNLVLQSSYRLTVAVCHEEEIPFLAEADYVLDRSTVVISKYVHASTLAAGVNISHKKSDQASICYPNISFSVEDFEESFSSLILSEVTHRFCVILSAVENRESSSCHEEASVSTQPSEISPSTLTQSKKKGLSGVRIFGGFVAYDNVKQELVGRQNWFKRVAHEHLITMNTPDGDGYAEVSASIDAESADAGSSRSDDEDNKSNNTQKALKFFKKGVESAKDLLQKIQGNEDGTAIELTSTAKLKFSCSLMTLTLPVLSIWSKLLKLNNQS